MATAYQNRHIFADNGLLSIFLSGGEASLLENLCAVHLFREYGEGLFFYNKNIEVDFYVPDEGYAVQVSYSISDEDTRHREVSALMKFHAFQPLRRMVIVPSDMENFGMIVPEALIVGTPVMASLGTPWKSLNDEQCGWWTDNSPESIAEVIKSLTSMSWEQRLAMGHCGREYILRTFSSEKIAEKMLQLYHWLMNEIPRPSFVDIL